MLAKGVEMINKQTTTSSYNEFIKQNIKAAALAQKNNNQPQQLRKIAISQHGLENKQPQWLRTFEVEMEHFYVHVYMPHLL